MRRIVSQLDLVQALGRRLVTTEPGLCFEQELLAFCKRPSRSGAAPAAMDSSTYECCSTSDYTSPSSAETEDSVLDFCRGQQLAEVRQRFGPAMRTPCACTRAAGPALQSCAF